MGTASNYVYKLLLPYVAVVATSTTRVPRVPVGVRGEHPKSRGGKIRSVGMASFQQTKPCVTLILALFAFSVFFVSPALAFVNSGKLPLPKQSRYIMLRAFVRGFDPFVDSIDRISACRDASSSCSNTKMSLRKDMDGDVVSWSLDRRSFSQAALGAAALAFTSPKAAGAKEKAGAWAKHDGPYELCLVLCIADGRYLRVKYLSSIRKVLLTFVFFAVSLPRSWPDMRPRLPACSTRTLRRVPARSLCQGRRSKLTVSPICTDVSLVHAL
jgi:hypothetical protein